MENIFTDRAQICAYKCKSQSVICAVLTVMNIIHRIIGTFWFNCKYCCCKPVKRFIVSKIVIKLKSERICTLCYRRRHNGIVISVGNCNITPVRIKRGFKVTVCIRSERYIPVACLLTGRRVVSADLITVCIISIMIFIFIIITGCIRIFRNLIYSDVRIRSSAFICIFQTVNVNFSPCITTV